MALIGQGLVRHLPRLAWFDIGEEHLHQHGDAQRGEDRDDVGGDYVANVGRRVAGEVQLHRHVDHRHGTKQEVGPAAHLAKQQGKHRDHHDRHGHRFVAEHPLNDQYREAHYQHVGDELAHHMTVQLRHHAQQQYGLYHKESAVIPAHQLAEQKTQHAAESDTQALTHVIRVQLLLAGQ